MCNKPNPLGIKTTTTYYPYNTYNTGLGLDGLDSFLVSIRLNHICRMVLTRNDGAFSTSFAYFRNLVWAYPHDGSRILGKIAESARPFKEHYLWYSIDQSKTKGHSTPEGNTESLSLGGRRCELIFQKYECRKNTENWGDLSHQFSTKFLENSPNYQISGYNFRIKM